MGNPTRKDPYANFNFLVEIDGVTAAGFQEVSGLEAEVEVIEYREGSDKGPVRKLPGAYKVSDVTLKRGVIQDASLWNWFKQVRSGTSFRSSVVITLLDNERQPVLSWQLTNAWPTKWAGPALNAKGNNVAIETLQLAHEGLELVLGA